MSKPRHQSAEGPSQRQLRVGETVRRCLSEALARGDVHDPELARFSITVGEVRMSPDLRLATAFVLPLGGEGRAEALEALRRNRGALRHVVARALALKVSPDLRFEIDETFDRMDAARRLFADPAVARDIEPPADETG
ncbi:MAG: 30S ribosome-binding factor RbfA [Alphaproteobacteria bacterium]|nr:30S ribosome-binding factor RbfA [Alphaproteobacteria bacterium]